MPDNNNLDQLLGELGQTPAFPVDWDQYERELMQRIWRQQAQRRRRTTWIAVVSTLAGAVATFVATVTWMPPPVQPQTVPKETPVATPQAPKSTEPPLRIVRRDDGTLVIDTSEPAKEAPVQPFKKRIPLRGGKFSEISFSGFTPPGEDKGSLIIQTRGAGE